MPGLTINSSGGVAREARPTGSVAREAGWPTVSGLALLTFLCGLCYPYQVSFVGTIFLIEPALIVLSLVVLVFTRGPSMFRNSTFKWLIALILLMLLGYMVSDVIQNTAPRDYQRGWGRIGFLILDIIALSFIIVRDKRLVWWLLLGIGVGQLLYLLMAGTPWTEWKFGYSQAVVPVLLCVSFLLFKRLSWVPFLLVGVFSMFMDSRAISAASILVAALLFIKPRVKHGLNSKANTAMIVIGVLLAAGVIVAALNVTDDEFSERRYKSSSGRFAALSISFQAVAQSPIIGLGSWSESAELARMLYEQRMADQSRDDRHVLHAGTKFRPHSQIMQAWIEGGILAPWFFLAVMILIIRGLRYAAETRQLDYFSPILIYVFVTQFWHTLASPFGGEHRIDLAICIGLLVLVSEERRRSFKEAPAVVAEPVGNSSGGRLLRRRREELSAGPQS